MNQPCRRGHPLVHIRIMLDCRSEKKEEEIDPWAPQDNTAGLPAED
jgi:hypothetical protein